MPEIQLPTKSTQDAIKTETDKIQSILDKPTGMSYEGFGSLLKPMFDIGQDKGYGKLNGTVNTYDISACAYDGVNDLLYVNDFNILKKYSSTGTLLGSVSGSGNIHKILLGSDQSIYILHGDSYVRKYNKDLVLQWSYTIPIGAGRDMTIDSNDNLYVVCENGATTVGTYALSSLGVKIYTLNRTSLSHGYSNTITCDKDTSRLFVGCRNVMEEINPLTGTSIQIVSMNVSGTLSNDLYTSHCQDGAVFLSSSSNTIWKVDIATYAVSHSQPTGFKRLDKLTDGVLVGLRQASGSTGYIALYDTKTLAVLASVELGTTVCTTIYVDIRNLQIYFNLAKQIYTVPVYVKGFKGVQI